MGTFGFGWACATTWLSDIVPNLPFDPPRPGLAAPFPQREHHQCPCGRWHRGHALQLGGVHHAGRGREHHLHTGCPGLGLGERFRFPPGSLAAPRNAMRCLTARPATALCSLQVSVVVLLLSLPLSGHPHRRLRCRLRHSIVVLVVVLVLIDVLIINVVAIVLFLLSPLTSSSALS